MFKFITSNKEKIQTAKLYLDPLNISFESYTLDILEPQSNSILEIAKYKAEKAYKMTLEPVVVSDHGWSITALNGFPGPYMKYVNEWLKPNDLLNLVAPYEDKEVIKIETLSYFDGKKLTQFEGKIKGHFLEKPFGQGLPAMQVITLSDSEKSMAECVELGIKQTEQRNIWEDFAEWFLKEQIV